MEEGVKNLDKTQMTSIFLKEINNFFSSLIGSVSMIVFLIITSVLLWLIPSYSVLNYGFATLEGFFSLAPILFLIIIPAITMRLIAEEKNLGTLEILFTKPISDFQIIIGKYLAALLLCVLSLVPTVIYYYSIYQLGYPKGNIDTGGVIGSYIGLFFLSSAFTAIGMFCSSVTHNQIIAFIFAVMLCSFLYWGFDLFSGFNFMEGQIEIFIKNLGIATHYESISKGVIDTRDILYFLSIDAIFILLSLTVLESRKW